MCETVKDWRQTDQDKSECFSILLLQKIKLTYVNRCLNANSFCSFKKILIIINIMTIYSYKILRYSGWLDFCSGKKSDLEE